MAEERRRTYLIDPYSQWAYIRRILLLESLVAAPSVLLTAVVASYLFSSGSEGTMWWTCLRSLGCVLILFVLLGGVLVFLGIRVSNHLFGPVFRFQDCLYKTTEFGEIPRNIQLREKDEFQNLAKSINSFFDRLRSERDERARKREDIWEDLEKLREIIESLPEGEGREKAVLYLREVEKGIGEMGY